MHSSIALMHCGAPTIVLALTACTYGRQSTAPATAPTELKGQVWTMTMWDPDGSGPCKPLVVAGGQFYLTGIKPQSQSIAAWNGHAWTPMGTGTVGDIRALASLPNGDLVAAGFIQSAGGRRANHIARWDGKIWSPLGDGLDLEVYALAVSPAGELVAGGEFLTSGSTALNRIAMWKGAAWQPIGDGFDRRVTTLSYSSTGDLIAGGWFTRAGSQSTSRVARWNGERWVPLGGGVGAEPNRNTRVGSVLPTPDGDLIVAGDFSVASGKKLSDIVRWNGSSWSALDHDHPVPTSSGSIELLARLPNGDIVVAGHFGLAGESKRRCIARWDGKSLSPMGEPNAKSVLALLVLPEGDLLAAALQQVDPNGPPTGTILRWDGATWSKWNSK